MKILVICQYYYPEPFRITDICETLVLRGHDVTVVTGTPNYPMGEVYKGYENGKKADEVINGVKIHRCIIAPRKKGTFNRLKNYFSYPRASKKYIKTLDGSFDVVFVNQLSPVMMAQAGIWYKKKHNKKLVLYCLDLWPESLCVGGVKKGSIIYKLFKILSKRIYQNADEILITSKTFRKYFKKMFKISDKKIHYLPQYAEAQFLELKEKKKKEKEEYFHLLFAGNIGTAQSVETIIDAAKLLVNEKVLFHIVGDGVELENLKKQAENLSNVIFYGRKPLEEMPKYYEMADAMLVTLVNDPVIGLTLPGKVQTYMAAGKPIVGAINGETAIVLKEAQGAEKEMQNGYCGEAQNSKQLAENILKLMKSGKAVEIGRKNKEYYLKMFSKEKFIDKLDKHLKNAVRNYI